MFAKGAPAIPNDANTRVAPVTGAIAMRYANLLLFFILLNMSADGNVQEI
jgi:hypothetical protein